MISIDLEGLGAADSSYLTWTPHPARLRIEDGALAGQRVTIRNADAVGRLLFSLASDTPGVEVLEVDLPADAAVSFFVAGKFGVPSRAYGDAVIEVIDRSGQVLGSRATMIRIRKDAVSLDAGERDRFLAAFGRLNDGGHGRFSDFRDMHTSVSARQAHGNSAFLPWHRAYLLDLERELQAFDESVALPYWRFDQPAPTLFSENYMGRPDAQGRLRFTAAHPLAGWVTDGQPGIVRAMHFAADAAPFVLGEENTLALGGQAFLYGDFIGMEGDPHGAAHSSFGGPISSVSTAARDPLFFMLHNNVDRLWAKWQWLGRRMDPDTSNAYASPIPDMIGHRLGDTMWPWNQIVGGPRPPTAPGGALAPSSMTNAPGSSPRVRDMIDYQGSAGGPSLAFAYDDVPFEM